MLWMIVVCFTIMLLFSAALAEDWQSEARSMLTLINSLRTGDSAWYWNRNNRTKTVETNLVGFGYDYQLEEVAKLRAAELARSFSHTRPDGSKWSTAFPAGNYYKGENIACGFESAADAFGGFLEENEDYAGQGHRRNMLNRHYTRIGLAAVEVDGTVYWVQEFASGNVVNQASGNGAAGWTLEDGKYYYRNTDGSPASGWLQDGDAWYYLDTDGMMQTGWIQVNGLWYYLNKDGAMQTGWMKDGTAWYHMDQNGVMQTGWIKENGRWYNLDQNGAMQTGWIRDGHNWYFANKKGEMQIGWVQADGKWYHFGRTGAMDTGWVKEQDKWYYCRETGEMVTGRYSVDNQTEVFNEYGVWQYSEINDYDTPLGVNLLSRLIQSIQRYFGEMLEWFGFAGD